MEIETLWHKNINFPYDFLLKLTASKPDYNTKNAINSLLKIQFFPREFRNFFPGNWESQNPEFPGNSQCGNSQCGTPNFSEFRKNLFLSNCMVELIEKRHLTTKLLGCKYYCQLAVFASKKMTTTRLASNNFLTWLLWRRK